MKNKLFYVLSLLLVLVLTACGSAANDEKASPTERIKAIVNDELGEKVSGEKRIDSVEVKEGIAYIKLNSNANAGSKRKLLKDAATIMGPISKIKDVEVIQLTFLAPLTDQYGKKTNEKVMFINMNRETLDKIDWKNFNYENIPQVANMYDQHESMKD